MSASGLLSTIAVAIDQILRLAPSIRPPIEPVVSRTNATSTAGLAMAVETAADNGRVASANANAPMVMAGFMVLLRWCVPRNRDSRRFGFP
jgi:hypothetical protein